MVDLYIVSVLLDAGAGPDWEYTEYASDGTISWKGGRSEGLAIASWRMFVDGVFSSDPEHPLQVDADGLKSLTVDKLAHHLQVSDSNPMAGLEGRCQLLIKLGSALQVKFDICPNGRPGDMLGESSTSHHHKNRALIAEYFKTQLPEGSTTLPLTMLWSTLFDLLLVIWPTRTVLQSYPTDPLGDVWPCPALERHLAEEGKERKEGDNLVVFHKLTQWLCYSLVEAVESAAGWKVDRGGGQTGLPEVCLCLWALLFADGSIAMAVC